MKTIYFSIFFLLIVSMLFVAGVSAENTTQWKLPEGAIARLGKGSIYQVQYFGDGSRFAAASSIGVWIYDAQTGEAIDLLDKQRSPIYALAVAPDGNMFASGDRTGQIFLWDAHTIQHKHVFTGHTKGSLLSLLVRMVKHSQA